MSRLPSFHLAYLIYSSNSTESHLLWTLCEVSCQTHPSFTLLTKALLFANFLCPPSNFGILKSKWSRRWLSRARKKSHPKERCIRLLATILPESLKFIGYACRGTKGWSTLISCICINRCSERERREIRCGAATHLSSCEVHPLSFQLFLIT